MEIADLARIVDSARRSAFRLETLPQYLVPQEAEEFAEWRAGRGEMATPSSSPWLAHVAERVASGVRWYRVHVLDQPLSDYSRYEIWGYRANQAAGEEIYLADREADLEDVRDDFWLVDDETAVRMIYDHEGRFVRPELTEDVGPYLEMRASALRHSEPLDDYIARRNLRLTA
ncbi:MAG TPA: hypothetical protein VGJ13_07960 [Pseudonocardiaceae bacterium]|jgi:hypothetical protein